MKPEIRNATIADLPGINRLVEAAVMCWDLPERVKRLAMPSYRYDEMDLQHLHMVVAEYNGRLAGIAAWEEANPADLPDGQSGLLLHGIYVDPAQWRQGTGSALFRAAEQAAMQQQKDGLLVKAQAHADSFFEKMGMTLLAVNNVQRDYANRFWKAVSPCPG